MNGHLSAGGGFQGGAVIASGVLLLLLARPDYRVRSSIFSASPSRWPASCSYLVGVAGLLFAGGFLDNRVLPLGQFGAFFSAGAIPVLSVLLGVKVGCELSVDRRSVSRLSRIALEDRVTNLPISNVVLATGFILILIGHLGHADPPQHPEDHHRLLADRHRHSYRHRGDRLCHERYRSDHRWRAERVRCGYPASSIRYRRRWW